MDLGAQRYVAITTRKRNGDTVSSPVWIAPLGDGRKELVGHEQSTCDPEERGEAAKARDYRSFARSRLQPEQQQIQGRLEVARFGKVSQRIRERSAIGLRLWRSAQHGVPEAAEDERRSGLLGEPQRRLHVQREFRPPADERARLARRGQVDRGAWDHKAREDVEREEWLPVGADPIVASRDDLAKEVLVHA